MSRPAQTPSPRLLTTGFVAWLGAATIAATGEGVLYFAIGWTAAGIGGTTAGVVLTLVVLPRTVLLLIGGAAGDRWGLRSTMIGCDLVMSAVLVAYLIAERTPISQVLLLAALALSLGIVSSFRMPAAGAFPRMFVPEETVPRAMSLTGSVLEIASLSGPPLGGVVVGLLAMTGAAATSLAGLLVGLIVLLLVRPRYEQPPAASSASTWHQITVAVRAARDVPGVPAMLTAVAFVAGTIIPLLSLCVPLAAHERGWSARATGLVETSWIVGALSVSLLVARVGTRSKPIGPMALGPAVASLGVLVIAWSPSPVAAFGGAWVMGVGTAAFTTHLFPLYLLRTPENMLARFQALLGVVQAAPMVIANNLLGTLATHIGPTAALLVLAGLEVVATPVLLSSPTLRRTRT